MDTLAITTSVWRNMLLYLLFCLVAALLIGILGDIVDKKLPSELIVEKVKRYLLFCCILLATAWFFVMLVRKCFPVLILQLERPAAPLPRVNSFLYNRIEKITRSREHPLVICCICMDNNANAAFVPCGHTDVCLDCICRLSTTQCPICRSPVETVLYEVTADQTA